MRTSLLLVLALSACTNATPKDKPAAAPAAAPAAPAAAAAATVAQHLGTPIQADVPVVALADVIAHPDQFKGKPIVTTGTVTAVCQEMGCWMEIKDGTSEAHIKMAGEKFFVPKTSAGKQARVEGTLTDVPDSDEQCAHEAAAQTGNQVAKLQLEATGVELE